MDDAQWDGLLLFNWGVFYPICFQFLGEALFQYDASLGIRVISGVGEFSQEVGCRICPPFLRNRRLPKSSHLALGLLGVIDGNYLLSFITK